MQKNSEKQLHQKNKFSIGGKSIPVPNMVAVHAETIANSNLRCRREREEVERKRKETEICKKSIPCDFCLDYSPENYPKYKE